MILRHELQYIIDEGRYLEIASNVGSGQRQSLLLYHDNCDYTY